MKCNIIAELGFNHLGDLSIAKEMTKAAVEAGVDYVKFQTWSYKNLKPGPWDHDGRRELYEQSELHRKDFDELYDLIELMGGKFMCSIFNHEDIDKLPERYTDVLKIPSPEIANITLLRRGLERFDHLLISTGASTSEEVRTAYAMCRERCTMFHCVSSYPCQSANANLNRLEWLKSICPRVGLSDHTTGVAGSAYGIAHGCTYIEKHFTIDQNLPGRDNKFSILPGTMKQICEIRDEIEIMTEDLGYEYQSSEQDIRDIYRGRWG